MSCPTPRYGAAEAPVLPTQNGAPRTTCPAPFQRVLFADSQEQPRYGVVSFSCKHYCEVILDGNTAEWMVTVPGLLTWEPTDTTGVLPMLLFRYNSRACTPPKHHLQARNYDLRLASGATVSECFFKIDRFLEIGGAHRVIALADVAALRPSA